MIGRFWKKPTFFFVVNGTHAIQKRTIVRLECSPLLDTTICKIRVYKYRYITYIIFSEMEFKTNEWGVHFGLGPS